MMLSVLQGCGVSRFGAGGLGLRLSGLRGGSRAQIRRLGAKAAAYPACIHIYICAYIYIYADIYIYIYTYVYIYIYTYYMSI